MPTTIHITNRAANYITVTVGDNKVTNGSNLLAAYAQAKATLPNGNSLSDTNRLSLILPPAIYDFGTQSLILDTQYIDIIGSTSDRSKHYITSNVAVINRGTVQQTANDVKLYNLTIENTNTTYVKNLSESDPSSYFPNTNLNLAYLENIECKGTTADINYGSSGVAFSMRIGIEYSGIFKNCKAGSYSFGSGGNASGRFIDCNAGKLSFGSGESTASGYFENCIGGDWCFGGGSTSGEGFTSTSAYFLNCKSGDNSYGFSVSEGTFINCIGKGQCFFGTLASNGTYINCTGGQFSFLSNLNGILQNCVITDEELTSG
ncbi:MAG: hypothetical protein RL736_20 [Pseudomonadota bacterium]|jgi:hypothetical protein